jgi:MiaB-like tRNA modifying enzyme
MQVYIETYGCTLNQADSDMMGGILRHAGFMVVKKASGADVVVLNTCTVKGRTENRIISRIEKLHWEKKKIVVAGCLSINGKRVRDACPDAVLVHPGAVSFIAEAVRNAAEGRAAEFKERAAKEGLPRIFTKPILRVPIQEGCVGNCHFCQTKLARPYLMSYSMKWIRSWIEECVKKGAKEVQLTGMDSGAYGLDMGTDLVSLLEEVAKIKGDFRVRLGMINPGHATKMLYGLLDAFEDRKFYKFFHLPVQTGSEKVREEMNRAHSVADFKKVVRAIRKGFPDACISTDIIVGYPTETEEDFGKTIKLLKEMKPDIVNVSKFASRRGTKAAELREIPTDEVKRRSTELSALVRKISAEKNRKYEGRKMEVLITEKGKSGKLNVGMDGEPGAGNRKLGAENWKGRAGNYKQVCILGKAKLGERMRVRITGSNHGSLFGKRI